jgi:ABC-type transporter Mla subunit MlaD
VSRLLGELPSLTRNLSLAVPAARGPSGTELRSAVRGFGRVALAVGSHPERVSRVVARADTTLAAVDVDNGAALDATLHSLPPALGQLRDGSAQLSDLAVNVRQAAIDARPAMAALTPVLRDGRPLLAKAAPVLRAARPLIGDTNLIVADLASATPPLRRIIDLAGHAIDTLDKRSLPALRAKSRLGQPAFDQFLSSGAGLTGALASFQTLAQNPFGAGHYARISGDVADGAFGAAQGDGCAQMATLLPSFHDELERAGVCH